MDEQQIIRPTLAGSIDTDHHSGKVHDPCQSHQRAYRCCSRSISDAHAGSFGFGQISCQTTLYRMPSGGIHV
jgi:hypothetical protein